MWPVSRCAQPVRRPGSLRDRNLPSAAIGSYRGSGGAPAAEVPVGRAHGRTAWRSPRTSPPLAGQRHSPTPQVAGLRGDVESLPPLRSWWRNWCGCSWDMQPFLPSDSHPECVNGSPTGVGPRAGTRAMVDVMRCDGRRRPTTALRGSHRSLGGIALRYRRTSRPGCGLARRGVAVFGAGRDRIVLG